MLKRVNGTERGFEMIVITEFMDEAAVDTLRQHFYVHYDTKLADYLDRIPDLLLDAQALIVRNRTQVSADLLSAAPHLKCIGRLGVGLDNIDVATCSAMGVTVYPATGANNLTVVEYVLTAAMVLLRRAWFFTPEMLDGRWPRDSAALGSELAGRKLGVVGLGGIARDLSAKARCLGLELLAHDPFVHRSDPAWNGVRNLGLDELMAAADVVSVHVPLNKDTRHLVDREAIARMKPGTILINAARGGVVDEEAVADALRAGHLGGAALDTFETEPLTREAASVFADAPNLILTPHIAGVSTESNERVSEVTARNILTHLSANP